jgi:integrase
MGLRPGEAVALDASDYADGWLTVARARKGKRLSAPVRGTKSGRPKRLPVPTQLAAWIAENVPAVARLERAPLFANPRTGGRWAPTSLRRAWKAALEAVGAPWISIYEGTKHTFATDATLRGVPERALQAFLGHEDVRSTRRYARLADQALVDVLPRLEAARRLQAVPDAEKPSDSAVKVVEAPGIEPGSARRPANASTCVATARCRRGSSR